MTRYFLALVAAAALAAGAVLPAPPAEAQGAALAVLTRDGRRTVPIVAVSGRDYVALGDVASAFGVDVREDRLAGGVTITAGGASILLSEAQAVVSVGGRLVSLPAPPVRQDGQWLVPVEFLPRALGPALRTRFDLRSASRLLVVGDLRVPRVSARVTASETAATVTIDISPAAPAEVMPETGRLVVSVTGADAIELGALGATPEQPFVQGLAPVAERTDALAILTGPRYASYRATTSRPDATTTRLTVEVRGTAPPTTTTPEPAAPEPATPAPGDAAPDPLLFEGDAPGVRAVVIDPGHGGDETGAVGPDGIQEKDVTLAVARRLRTLIESRLGLRVYLTREDDRTLSLDDRTAYANSHRADIFLSVHANASVRAGMRGAEVYYLSADRATTDGERAQDTGTALPALGGGTRTIDLMLWETAQTRYLEQSAALATTVERTLAGRVAMSPRTVQQAPFRVLVGATMPAVLVEMGYLSNPEEERQLGSGSYQDRLALALFDAIASYRTSAGRGTAQE
ncbi:MAG: N-acetylmuramoyl-L-alanine amidase [Vicinamibacterales bacterium]